MMILKSEPGKQIGKNVTVRIFPQMAFKLSLRVLHENILRYFELFSSIITVIYFLTVLASYAYGPPGALAAAVIFQRTASAITPADETEKNKK